MDRRQFGDSFFARTVHGSSYYSPTRQRMTEDELVARSKEWINRQERDRGDPWKRSVDDFLDDRAERPSGRYRRSRDRDRGSRDRSSTRSRSRDRDSRKEKRRERSRDRERGSRRWTPEDDDRDHDSSRRHNRREDRKERHSRYEDRHSSKKTVKEDEDDNKHWSSGDEENSNSKSDQEYDYRSYSSYTADNTLRPEDRFAYKKQTPQRTIIIRGLAQHITEQDIQEDILLCNLTCRDIRLVRRKHTGTSRGFAFVEFRTVEDATKWIESKQGELMLKDHFRALLQYSLPKDSSSKDKWLSDWYCKCQAHNFRRRETCFKCNLSRQEGETAEGVDQVSAHPTNTVLLRGLDALTTEESVLQSIKTLSSLPIRSVRIGRDAATSASRGVCYLEMNNVVDAMYLYNAFQTSPPLVDGRTPAVAYAKLDPLTMHSSSSSGQIANVALAAAQWSHQKNETQYKLSDVPRLAEQSAAMYATNAQEKAAYIAYYEDYYRKQIANGEQVNLPVNNTSGLATAQAAMAAHKKSKDLVRTPLTDAPDGSGHATYVAPDVTTYQFDSSSGYYYDPYTTLYYDASSQYYYNNKLRKFLYWDATRKTFLPAPSSTPQPQPTDAKAPIATISAEPVQAEGSKEDDSKKGKEKESEKDKVKVAKRIAKDMERWAKTLNQKKEIAKQNITAAAAATTNLKAGGAADIGYAVLERKDISASAVGNGVNPRAASNESLVAAYGQGSDSDEEDESAQEDKLLTDWAKLACLLCKRQFPSKDALVKHQQLSDLHRQNLSAWYKSKGLDPDDAQNRRRQYRDRARERRMKYGEPDAPPASKLKESYMKAREAVSSYEEPTKDGIGADNLGNKLLQKMGWQEGMGLGKKNQGRTSIIQAERRSATAGLGTKHVGVTPGPGETYKDCVKKMMQIRYSEINDQ